MTITYKWEVSNLKRVSEPEPDTIQEVRAYLHGKDDNGYSQTEIFTVNLVLPESYESGSFTDFDNLTKDQVISWVMIVLGIEGQDEIKRLVSKKIEDHYKSAANPTALNKHLPW
tara:strand:- start:18 stop:359 length:342 start_codon:yes stop_codon:yes gene_type:complete